MLSCLHVANLSAEEKKAQEDTRLPGKTKEAYRQKGLEPKEGERKAPFNSLNTKSETLNPKQVAISRLQIRNYFGFSALEPSICLEIRNWILEIST